MPPLNAALIREPYLCSARVPQHQHWAGGRSLRGWPLCGAPTSSSCFHRFLFYRVLHLFFLSVSFFSGNCFFLHFFLPLQHFRSLYTGCSFFRPFLSDQAITSPTFFPLLQRVRSLYSGQAEQLKPGPHVHFKT